MITILQHISHQPARGQWRMVCKHINAADYFPPHSSCLWSHILKIKAPVPSTPRPSPHLSKILMNGGRQCEFVIMGADMRGLFGLSQVLAECVAT